MEHLQPHGSSILSSSSLRPSDLGSIAACRTFRPLQGVLSFEVLLESSAIRQLWTEMSEMLCEMIEFELTGLPLYGLIRILD